MSTRPSVYDYIDSHAYLSDAWSARASKRRSHSLRAWARQLGMRSDSPLSLVLKGKRALPKKYLPNVITTLGLSPEEGRFLETLIDLSRAREARERAFYVSRLARLRPARKIGARAVDEFLAISDPLHSALIEMTATAGFRPDPFWIRERLRVPATLLEVDGALERLLALGLLAREGKHLRKSHANLTTEPDVQDLAARSYHQAVSRMAVRAVEAQKMEEREFNSYSFAMRARDLPGAKVRLRSLLDDFFKEFEAPQGEGESVFQLSLQLFRMTK